jgi:hypothetical protein
VRLVCTPLTATLSVSLSCLKVPFQYYERNKLRYPAVNSYEIGWINHYYTRSVEEYVRKNARGSAQYGKRKDPTIPPGIDDVVNFEILYSTEARLAALAAEGITPSRDVDRLARLLLKGAPSLQTRHRMEALYASRGVFNQSFVAFGAGRQRAGVWPEQITAADSHDEENEEEL